MLIFESQRDARSESRKLLLAFALTVLLLVVLVNAALALAWGLTWGFWVPGELSLPRHFIAVNTTVVLVNGSATVFGAQLANASTDNCSVTSYMPSAQTYVAPGVYNLPITVRDWSNNGATCTSVVTVLPSGPAERPAEEDPKLATALKVSLYPNPTSGLATAEFHLPEAGGFTLRVYYQSGTLALSQKGMGAAGENNVTVRMDGLQSGLYLLEVRSGDLVARKRVLLQR